MTFEEFWVKTLKEKPIEDDQSVKLTKKQFRAMLLKSFTQGFFQCHSMVRKGENINDYIPKEVNIHFQASINNLLETMKNLFGGK